ncbi:wsc domain-containing protein [Apiospora arundinis]
MEPKAKTSFCWLIPPLIRHRRRRQDGRPPYALLGCYVDSKANRTLPVFFTAASETINASMCHAFCNTPELQAVYFGLEYGMECWCGAKRDADNSTFQLANPQSECDLKCNSSSTGEMCGGNWRLSLYRILDPVQVDPPSETGPNTPSATGTPEDDTQGGGSRSLSGGAIAGITVAALLAVALLALLVMFLMRRRQKRGTKGRRVARTGVADPQADAGGSGTGPQMAAAGGAVAAAGSSNHSREGAGGNGVVGGGNSKAKVGHREGEVGGSARGGTASIDGESLVAGAPYHHQAHNDDLPGYQSSAR